MAGSIVQSAQNFSTTAGTSKAVTLTGTTAGNAIVVFAHDGSGTSKAMTCADNVNGSYGTQVDSLNDATNGNTLRSWVKGNIAGGSVTVTVSFPASDIFIGLYAAEVTGVSTAPLDGHHAQTQSVANGAAISSGAGTNAATAFMLALSVRDDTSAAGSIPSVGSGFTVDPTFTTGVWNYGNGNNALVEFKASVAAGSNAASFTNSSGSTGTFNTLMVMLDESSGGGSPVTVSPPAGSLTLTGKVPTVTVTQNQLVKPPAGSLTLTGFAPTVTVTANQKVLPPAGSLTLTGFAPTLVIGSNVIVAPPAGSLSLTGFAPTVKVSANQRVSPPAGSLTLTGLVPTVKVTQNILVHAPLATLALTGLPPSVIGSGVIPAAPTGPTPAGRKRKRYYVEVDGVQFDVDDSEQARSILERAKTLAKEAAEQSALIIERTHRLTTETIAPVKLSAPRIKASPELRLPLKSVRRSINKIYREKSVILELRMWLELEQRLMEDDEEAMLLLN